MNSDTQRGGGAGLPAREWMSRQEQGESVEPTPARRGLARRAMLATAAGIGELSQNGARAPSRGRSRRNFQEGILERTQILEVPWRRGAGRRQAFSNSRFKIYQSWICWNRLDGLKLFSLPRHCYCIDYAVLRPSLTGPPLPSSLPSTGDARLRAAGHGILRALPYPASSVEKRHLRRRVWASPVVKPVGVQLCWLSLGPGSNWVRLHLIFHSIFYFYADGLVRPIINN